MCIVITEKQKQIIIKEMKPYEPTKIGVFGSYARGDNGEDSDIDILYSFNNTPDLAELAGLKRAIGKKLNKKVDLMCFEYINPYIKKQVLGELRIFFHDKNPKEKRPPSVFEHH